MADELNVPTHRWYEPRNNIALPPNAVSAKYILANGVALIDAWINSRPWGPYSVDGFVPPLALDFVADYYQTDSTATTFDSALTATRAGNATMVDSDGKIKWAPHNLLTYSEQFDNAAWKKFDGNVIANSAAAPDGTNTADLLVENTSTAAHVFNQTLGVLWPDNTPYTATIYAKAAGRSIFWIESRSKTPTFPLVFFDLASGLVTSATNGATGSIQAVGNGWYRCTLTANSLTGATSPNFLCGPAITTGSRSYTGDGTSGVLVWGAHLYQSNLGGMVDVPADARAIPSATKYVPTTSAARYLPRRGHHVYNGSEWVNEGLLVESEARTNLLLNSGTLATQSVTVAAVANTLSFTGTGTVTLSGASTAGPLVGVGTGENNRVFLTFTPTAGTLTLTVSGTVTNAQLEAGSTPSSYIPTAGATVTRAAETLVIPSANLPWPSPQYVTGTELVTNGTFDTDTSGWTAFNGAGLSVVSGKLRVTNGVSGRGGAGQAIPTVAGKVYTLTLDGITSPNSTNVFAYVGSALGGSSIAYLVNTNGTGLRLNFVAQGSETWITVLPADAATGDYNDFDNISVKEINPLSVSIAMDGRMTYADDGAILSSDGQSGTVIPWRWVANTTNYIDAVVDTESASTGKIWFMQEVGGVFDYSATSGNYLSPGINVPFNIASRHGSTFINGAVDGVALTADLTPVALPDLSATDLQLGYAFMGVISKFRVWSDDLGNAGIAEASA